MDRENVESLLEITVLNENGEMVPLSAFATQSYTVGPRVVTRFNQSVSAEVNASVKPGYSSGQLMKTIQKIVDEKFQGYEIAWTDMSYQEQGNEGKVVTLMLLALIFAYLFLVGQYESWTMPVSVILSVSVAVLGALIGLKIAGLSLSIYAQLGLIMLIGLSGKSAILMAEFSKQAREEGLSIDEAAIQGGSKRYRAVLMTAWSFVIGVFPMVIATGACSGSRQAIGVTTFSGMVVATLFGIMLVPPLFAVFQRLREFFQRLHRPAPETK